MASAHAILLETLAREAAFKLKRSSEYRTSASILLAECRRRVDEGDPAAHGAAWPEYCRVTFPSYPTHEIDRLIEGSAPADDRARPIDRAPRTDAFDRAWAAFTALDVADQRDFLRCGAAYAIHPEDESGRPAAEPAVEAPRVLDWLA
jgi:hypothetical protein